MKKCKLGLLVGFMALALTFPMNDVDAKSYKSKRPTVRKTYKPKPRAKIKQTKPKAKINTSKVTKKPTKVVKTTNVRNTTVINNNNGGGISGSGVATGIIVGSMLTPTVYHTQPYHDPYSNRTIDFTCIDGMKYRLTSDGGISKVRGWNFRHKVCNEIEIQHYSQGRR